MAEAPEAAHFTVHVEVTKTDARRSGTESNRRVTQIANVTVRDAELAKLIVKAGKHLELVEDV